MFGRKRRSRLVAPLGIQLQPSADQEHPEDATAESGLSEDGREPSAAALMPRPDNAFGSEGHTRRQLAAGVGGAAVATAFLAAGGIRPAVAADDLSGPYNVKTFGAKGDGVTDDAAAIQSAIAAHYLVYFPAGTYKCLSSLVLRNGSRLLGEARGIAPDSGNVVQIDSRVVGLSDTPWAIKIPAGNSSAGSGITIENIWVKGIASASPDYSVSNFPSYGIYGGTQTNGLLIRNCTITNFTINVALLDATLCKIDHCSVRNAITTNLLLYGSCGQIKVTDTSFVVPNEIGTAAAEAILSNIRLQNNGALFPSWVSIDNCQIDEVAKNGQSNPIATVRLGRCENVSIKDSIIYVPTNGNGGANPGGGYGVSIGVDSKRVFLENVRVKPYTNDANHVPVNTILIDATATGTVLDHVTTDPNGGGDIADNAPDTTWINVKGITKVSGGLAPGAVTTLPAPTAANRGQLLRVNGDGTADSLYQSRRTATGTYSWVELADTMAVPAGVVLPPAAGAISTSEPMGVAPAIPWFWIDRFWLQRRTSLRYVNFHIGVSSGNIQVCVLKYSSPAGAYTRVMGGNTIACPAAGGVRLDLGATILEPGDYGVSLWVDNATVRVRHGVDGAKIATRVCAHGQALALPATGTRPWGSDRWWGGVTLEG